MLVRRDFGGRVKFILCIFLRGFNFFFSDLFWCFIFFFFSDVFFGVSNFF